MRRALLIAALAAFAATAVTAFAQTTAPPTRKSGVLTVGFDVPAPGFWNGRVTGTTILHPTGFEADMARAIAKQLGISKITYLRAPFGGLFSPAAKPFDFAMEEVTITPERAGTSLDGPSDRVSQQLGCATVTR